MDFLRISLALLPLLSFGTAQGTVSLSITPQPTAGVSKIVNPSFAGFGIEPSNLYSFTGGSKANALTNNLLSNLANLTGAPPHLRIGGNTEDYMIYDASMNDYVVETNPNPSGQGVYASDSMIIGPRYFEVINRFPANTPITYGLNLAYQESDYIDRITTMAHQAVNRLTDVSLVSMEIGNEPDLYLQNMFRSDPQWGGQEYSQQWLTRANAVYNQVLKPKGIASNFFEPACTASTIGTSFMIEDLVTFDITQNANGSSKSLVSQWNQHDYYYYIGVSTYPLTLDLFLSLPTTNTQFASWVSQIEEANTSGYRYALREMGVVGPIGLYGITDVFGAALWGLNFFLYAATVNITSVEMHMTDNSNASAWQPIEMYGNQPFVRPIYYSFAAFDQAIGPTCQARVGGFDFGDVPDGYTGRVSGYSVYQAGTLGSIILINSNPVNVSDSNKPSLTFDLNLGSQFAGDTLYLAYLTNDGADARHGTTFNGISYEQSGDGTPTTVDNSQQTAKIGSDGSVTIQLRDTQAVVANIGSPVGQRKANSNACQSLSQQVPGVTSSGSSGSSGTSGSSGSSSSSSASSSTSSSAASSRTGSAAGAMSTSGVTGLSSMLLSTLVMCLTTGVVILFN